MILAGTFENDGMSLHLVSHPSAGWPQEFQEIKKKKKKKKRVPRNKRVDPSVREHLGTLSASHLLPSH